MAQTIFILGTDPQQCKELRDILQDRVTHKIVTAGSGEDVAPIQETDTIIITSEEQNTGVLYHRLLNKLEEQVHRADLLSELIRLFSSSLQIEELMDRVVTKSTEVLGDTAFIILLSETGQLKLEASFSTDRDRLIKMLMTAVNVGGEILKEEFLSKILKDRESVVIPHVPFANLSADMKALVDKLGIMSLLAVPIHTKEVMLGLFVSLSTEAKSFTQDDVTTASSVADFTAIALENAGLFAELQRSATTDALTGVFNTRFFHEVLGRETARADRYSTPLSLLMIDIDTFKLVNDTFGHVVGNKVLTQVAKTLETAVRNTDFVFRCGGDEFGVVLPGTDQEGAMRAAQKILKRIEMGEMLTSLGYSGRVTVSIGVSEYRRGSHFETLVAEADQALYVSKRGTKNCAKAFKA